jgi:3-oxoacyl-[acyl-carrier protein] reductase
MIDLKGKVALVTGGSRGIGRAIVLLLFRAGARVAFSYLQAVDRANELIGSCPEGERERLLAIRADLTKKSDAAALVGEVMGKWGTIDITVNNAGIWTGGGIDEMDEETWVGTIEANLNSVYYICREIVPIMKKNRSGCIINISSTAGQRGEDYHSHYAASKGGIISFTKSLATELGPYGIRTNCVAPGWVHTDMTEEVFRDTAFLKKVEGSIPLRYIANPDEIAGPVLFLASGLATYINGEIINVNGGSVLCG